MLKEFYGLWESNSNSLLTKLKETTDEELTNYGKRSPYEGLMELVVKFIFKKRYTDIQSVDFGDCQGTIILCFATASYQPTIRETYYTFVDYGSCSGCDTYLAITEHTTKQFNEKIAKDLLTLCLHLFQNIHTFGENNE